MKAHPHHFENAFGIPSGQSEGMPQLVKESLEEHLHFAGSA
jgi:hypothetical protein